MAWLSGGDGPFLGFIRSKASVGKVGKMHRCDNSRERTKDVYIYIYILYMYISTYTFCTIANSGFLFLTSQHFKMVDGQLIFGLYCAKKSFQKNRKMDGIVSTRMENQLATEGIPTWSRLIWVAWVMMA